MNGSINNNLIFNIMGNLDYYNKLKAVPQQALRQIQSGRLRGKHDINPMWRIKAMTEQFGACGIGWKYVITKQWTETFGSEVKAYCNIDLFIKVNGEWSDAIQGTGGSSEVSIESKGAYVSDECYKMALTDALSVAMKALGVAADVYFEAGKDIIDTDSKYGAQDSRAAQQAQTQQQANTPTQAAQQQAASQYHPNDLNEGMGFLSRCVNKDNLIWVVQTYKPLTANPQFMQAVSAKRKELGL
nr:MAG TPA: DNA repair protein-like protein [Caudoviricetes sp.]